MILNIYIEFISVWILLSVIKGSVGELINATTEDEQGYRGELLKFWEPDPQFDESGFRKAITLKNQRINKKGHHSQWRRLEEKIQPINQYQRFHHEKVLSNNKSGNILPLINYRGKSHKNKHPLVALPKKNINEFSTESLQYTRMPPMPMLLRQQEGEKSEIPKKRVEKMNDKASKEAGPLNVYALIPQLKKIFDNFPEANATHEIIGRTASYIDIVLYKISKSKQYDTYLRADDSKYVEEVPEKKIIFIVHALSSMGIKNLFSLSREKYIQMLLSYYIKHLDKFDIFLIPMANPDGYVKNDLLIQQPWNKNISPQDGCPGVNLDRNFDVAWNGSLGISTCSQNYPGATPFSEPESRAVRDVFHRYSHKIIAYFHVHAGTYNKITLKGDAVLYPRGYTDVPVDDDKYLDMKGEIEEAMRNASFKAVTVTVDTIHNWYGQVSGTSVDYASTIYGIPYAMELVMQIYVDPVAVILYMGQVNWKDIEYYALTEIWSRALDSIFNSIYKNINPNE